MSRLIYIPNFKSISQNTGKKSPENYIFAKGNNSIKSRSNETKVELHLYYVKTNSYMKFEVHVSKKIAKKSPEKYILAKGYNSSRRRSNVTKVELDLYYVKTNLYTKFQVNISKDD